MRNKKWLLIVVLLLVLLIVIVSGDSGDGAVRESIGGPESKAEQFVQNVPARVLEKVSIRKSDTGYS